jgi:hypothetical protein
MVTDNTQEKKIDPAEAGISMAGLDGPSAYIDGKEKYRRIFIRLRTPYETLTCSPIEDGADFARRASIIENWFNSIVRKGNFVLTFDAVQITDEDANTMFNLEREQNND